MAEIALFGGSFDPPHVGHLLAAAYVLATEPVDELWLVPVFAHPFAKPLTGSYEHRVLLCEKLAQELPRTKVSRAEEESGETRTVDLLEWLHRTFPQHRWSLVLGTDLDAETAQWKRFDRIQQLARIVMVERGGHMARGGVVIPEVSSTEVRTRLKQAADVSRLVPRAVLQAIRDAGTYR
jgi:nicotinate-nucleotide adenylyltransferase